MDKKKVLVGLSGGVDSAVSAALLLKFKIKKFGLRNVELRFLELS